MSAAAGAMALGSVAGGYMSAQGSKAAAAAQERIAAQNIAFQKEMYNQNVARLAPWTTYGQNMLGALESQMPSLTSKYDYAKYQTGPEYQNMLAATARQQKALEAQGSASGMYGSGTMANQLQQNAAYLAQQGYQQGLSNYWGQNQNIYNMLNSGATLGEQAAAQQAASGEKYASAVGGIYNNQATNTANALQNQYNAYGGALSQVGNIAGNYLAQQDVYNQQQAANQQNWYNQSLGNIMSGWNSFTGSLGSAFSPSSTANDNFGGWNRLASSGSLLRGY